MYVGVVKLLLLLLRDTSGFLLPPALFKEVALDSKVEVAVWVELVDGDMERRESAEGFSFSSSSCCDSPVLLLFCENDTFESKLPRASDGSECGIREGVRKEPGVVIRILS
jgi:hypothetical protein